MRITYEIVTEINDELLYNTAFEFVLKPDEKAHIKLKKEIGLKEYTLCLDDDYAKIITTYAMNKFGILLFWTDDKTKFWTV